MNWRGKQQQRSIVKLLTVIVTGAAPNPYASDEMGESDSAEDTNRDDAKSVDKINLIRYEYYIGAPARKGLWIQGCVIFLDIGNTDDEKEVVLIHVVFDDRDK